MALFWNDSLDLLTTFVENLAVHGGKFFTRTDDGTGDFNLHYIGRNKAQTAEKYKKIQLEWVLDQKWEKIQEIAQSLINAVEYELDPYGLRS